MANRLGNLKSFSHSSPCSASLCFNASLFSEAVADATVFRVFFFADYAHAALRLLLPDMLLPMSQLLQQPVPAMLSIEVFRNLIKKI